MPRTLLFLFALASALVAEDAPKPGHSNMGKAFDHGPRQAAYLMGGTGDVHLEITTVAKEAQLFFNQGLGQLHGFWFREAERSFRQALKIDPECPMALWGMAMATITENRARAAGFANKLRAADLSAITERERLWIHSITNFFRADEDGRKDDSKRADFIEDLEAIIYAHPEEIEAKAFIGSFIYHWRDTYSQPASRAAIDGFLLDVLEENPRHPVHHYRIHLWDREVPKRALEAAATAGPSAPQVAHMWHMPGHVYSALHRYADAAWQQEAASRVDHSHMIRDRVMPDEIHNYAHNQEWLVRNFQLIGDCERAVALAEDLIENPRHPSFNRLGHHSASASYGRSRLLQTLIKFEQWEDLITACHDGRIDPTDIAKEQARRLHALSLAYTLINKHRLAEESTEAFKSCLAGEKKAQAKLSSKARRKARKEEKSPAEIEQAGKTAVAGKLRDFDKWAGELELLSMVREGDLETVTEPLQKSKMDRLIRALLWQKLGETDKAISQVESALSDHRSKLLANAMQVWLLEEAGRPAEALASFVKLRKLAAHADLSAPPFARLTAVAERAYHPAGSDWRWPAPAAKDLGKRPALDSLGPLRWEPLPAPHFRVKTTDGELLDNKNLSGHPTVLLFFLGHACSHCVEQIDAFAALQERFADAGIKLAAIANEPTDELADWNASRSAEARLSFPLAGDPKGKLFQKFRAFDDFEEMPLHGVFFLDANGRIRWQDISAEPFMDGEFLLQEAQRLLKLHDPARLAGE